MSWGRWWWWLLCGYNKENSCHESKESVFLGKQGSTFFSLTQIEEQRTDGNVRRAGKKKEEEEDGRQNMWA